MIETAILAWLLAQPRHSTDIDEPDDHRLTRMSFLAESIGIASNGSRTMAAALLMLAREESGLRRDVQEGQCPPHLCDRGRARSPFQLHRPPSVPHEVWIGWAGAEYGNVQAAAIQAASMLRAGAAKCRGIAGSFAYYATGGQCRYSAAEKREAMTREIERRM